MTQEEFHAHFLVEIERMNVEGRAKLLRKLTKAIREQASKPVEKYVERFSGTEST